MFLTQNQLGGGVGGKSGVGQGWAVGVFVQAFFISSQVQVKYAPLLIITIQVLNQLSAYISNASQLSRQFFLPLF